MSDEVTLGHTFVGLAANGEKIEGVWVLQRFLCKLGLRCGQRPCEVSGRLALTLVDLLHDLRVERRAAPAVFVGTLRVPEALVNACQLFEEQDGMTAMELCHMQWQCF